MNHMKQTLHARVWPTLAATGIAIALASACNSGQGSSSDLGSYAAELNTDLGVCSVAHATCLQAADGDVSKIQSCKDERGACADAVQAARKEVHDAIRACADTARTCFHNVAPDAGHAALHQCGQQLRACVDDALPPPPPLPPCAAALKQCLSSTSDGGSGGRRACVQTFHACVDATLPPCMHGLATCIADHDEPPFACRQGRALTPLTPLGCKARISSTLAPACSPIAKFFPDCEVVSEIGRIRWP